MRFLVRMSQILCYFFMRFFAFFLHAQYIYSPGAEFHKGSLLVSNHQSRLDPILIHLGIPFRDYVKLIPIYELTAEYYMKKWWKKIPLMLIGCIPIDTSSKKKSALGLYTFLEKIEQGETVMIFPEGYVSVLQKRHDIFAGAGYIVHYWNPGVLPVHVSGFSRVSVRSFVSRTHRARIVYGRGHITRNADVRRTVKHIMDTIYSL